MSEKKVFRVLVCVDLSAEAGRQKLGGIYRFLSQGYVWDMSLIRSQKEFEDSFCERIADTTFDGFLVAIPENADMRLMHENIGKPTAFIDYLDPKLSSTFKNCVFIHDDDIDIGRHAAQELLSLGPFSSYGYAASSVKRPWNRNRGDQLKRALSRRHITPLILNDTDRRSIDDIASWLKALPRPAGILAAYDDTARHVLDACQAAGLKVPSDISILGIGNDELICLHTSPQLSSIIPDFQEEGYRAARELQAMMLRKRAPTKRELVCGCLGIARRGSTAREKNAAMLVQQAVSYIAENAFRRITAADVVNHLRVSRRLADLRFRDVTGTSILAYITDVRLNRVKELLSSTDLRIGEIARQCGYEAANLKNLFARHFKCSMRTWRKANRLREHLGLACRHVGYCKRSNQA